MPKRFSLPSRRQAIPDARGGSPALHSPSQVARLVGIHVETLRYYERLGLLPPPERTGAGRRLYPEETIELLRSIRTARTLGIRIAEILSVFSAVHSEQQAHRVLTALLENTLARTRSEIKELKKKGVRLVEAVLVRVRAKPSGDEVKRLVRRAWRSQVAD